MCLAYKKATRVAWFCERLSQNNRWKTEKSMHGTIKKSANLIGILAS